MKRRRAALACLVISMFFAAPRVTSAAESEESAQKEKALDAFQEAIELYDAGVVDGALLKFQEAYKIKPHPDLLYNIAWCFSELGRNQEALEKFLEYLASGTDIPEGRRLEVEVEIERLRGKLFELVISVSQEEVDIFVDGEGIEASSIDTTVWLDPGTHQLRAVKTGFHEYSREIVAEAGKKTSIKIELKPRVPAHQAGAESIDEKEDSPPPVIEGAGLHEGASGLEEAAPGSEQTLDLVDEQSSRTGRIGPAAFVTFMTVSGVALLTSAITGGLALKGKDEFYSMTLDDDWKSLKKKTENLAIATDVLWGVAGASLIIGLILAAVTDFRRESHDDSLAFAVTSDSAMMVYCKAFSMLPLVPGA